MNRTTNTEVPSVEETPQPQRRANHRHVCPECGKESVQRARRRTLGDYLFAFVGQYPYRCHECDYRFHTRRRTRPRRRSQWASCPRCSSTELGRVAYRKVPPTWGNLPWRLLQAPAYRCPGCRRRFFDYRPQRPEKKEE